MTDAPVEKDGQDAVTGFRGVMSPSFLGLLFTQFLTATNDNIFRWLVIGIGKQYVAPSSVGTVLMAGTACFVLPYLFLAAPAGYLADRFSKRTVIVCCKFAEIVIMSLGVAAILLGNLWLLMAVVALMGAQSALFSPSKLGAIPEIVKSDRISVANGFMGLTTVCATLIGMAVGNWLTDVTGMRGQPGWWVSALVLVGVATVGLLLSLAINPLQAANPKQRFPFDAFTQTVRNIRTLFSQRALFRVALGITFFWSLGALAQLNIDQYAIEGGALRQTDIIFLLWALGGGVGVGSILAGVWSGGRIELGIVPLGAFFITLGGGLLFFVQGDLIEIDALSQSIKVDSARTASYTLACGFLFILGTGAGLFNVPLASYMQHRSPRDTRGAILAAGNFLTFSGILGAALLFNGLRVSVEEGSLSNIAALQKISLSNEAQHRVEDSVRQYSEQLQAAHRHSMEEPDMKQFLNSASGEERQSLFSQLVWTELRAQQSTPLLGDYLETFDPDDRALVRDLVREARDKPLRTSRQIFLLCGLFTIPVLIYAVWVLPQATIRFLVWLASHTAYRIRIQGLNHLPERGGALLISNHVSWLDGILLLLASSRPVRLFAWSGNFKNRWVLGIARFWGAILITGGPKSIVKGFQRARDALDNGELVAIFPEGGITRSGQIQGFKPGVMKILEDAHVPVVPVYLDELWGSIFSFERGKFFWKWPKRWPYPITIYFGQPIEPPHEVHQLRRAVQDLGAGAAQERMQKTLLLPRAFVRSCKQRKRRMKMADTTGVELTGYALLARSLVLRRLLRRHVLTQDERYIGLLLPPSVAGVAANMALALDRRVSVNLNYTVSSDVMNSCVAQAEIKHILTSRKFFEKINEREPLHLEAELIFLEDFKDKPTLADKLVAGVQTFLTPATVLERWLGLHKIVRDDVLTIIFTSGSTGQPKGVMLTHGNISSNVEAINQVVHLTSDDVLIGVLPFFHSFGYTITMWTVASIDLAGVYHFNPLDPKQIAKICQRYGGTILLATPTFLRSYLRRCGVEEFSTLDVVVAGAEKLPTELCQAFEDKFGVRPVEGYGATELSPLASVNVPPSRSLDNFQTDAKEETVGRPIPGVTAKVLDLDSGEELGAGQAGMLWVGGPNVMKGYLGRPDLTEKVLVDDWYKTGDIALIDKEGFIKITGRESRFSKIGGEMVPHILIEETLARLIGGDEEEGLKAAVTAAPDAKKGERLIVIHTPLEQTPDQLRKGLTAEGLPNIYIPSSASFYQVDELPILGTGKFDLKAIKQIAMDQFGPDASDSS